MKKSIARRIRITKRGRVMRRPMGVDHFRTRKTQKNLRGKKKTLGIDYPLKKVVGS